MRPTITLITLLASFSVFAQKRTITDCKVTEVINTRIFQESLSVEEYPDVEVEKDEVGMLKVRIGASVYSEIAGDYIDPQNAVGMQKGFTVITKDRNEGFSLMVFGRPGKREGKLVGTTITSEGNFSYSSTLIANLNCK